MYKDWADEALLQEYGEMCVTTTVMTSSPDTNGLREIREEILRRMRSGA